MASGRWLQKVGSQTLMTQGLDLVQNLLNLLNLRLIWFKILLNHQIYKIKLNLMFWIKIIWTQYLKLSQTMRSLKIIRKPKFSSAILNQGNQVHYHPKVFLKFLKKMIKNRKKKKKEKRKKKRRRKRIKKTENPDLRKKKK